MTYNKFTDIRTNPDYGGNRDYLFYKLHDGDLTYKE
jgi:hypothetical protein